jgi:RNase P subunit RPR2
MQVTQDVTGKSLPGAVTQQMQYLWSSAESMALAGQSSVSQNLLIQLVRLASKNNVALPGHIKEKMCSVCSAMLLPSLTCRMRVCGKKRGKFKNQIVVRCLRCNEVAARRDGAPRKHVIAQPPPPILAPAQAQESVQAAPPVKLSTSSLGGDFVPLSLGGTAKKRMNLLELERENKKKKKIKSSVGGAGEGGGTGRSLTALAGLFNSARR